MATLARRALDHVRAILAVMTETATTTSGLRIGGTDLPVLDRARIYCCGITPYDVTHLGHAATFVWVDVLTRVLGAIGVNAQLCRNVTDVDDVLFAAAEHSGSAYDAFASVQQYRFDQDMTSLGVREPQFAPRARRNVGQVIRLAAALLEVGAAYLRDGSVYFRGAGTADAAGLSRDDAEALAAEYGARLDDPAKDDKLDVAVWRRSAAGEPGWPSPWGTGRPGWHAECAAMSLSVLGLAVDVLCGGADLRYPHHAYQVAMAQAVTGVRPFARARFSVGVVSLDGAKMAKSTGNLVLVSDVLADHPAAALRLCLLDRPWAQGWDYASGRARRRDGAARAAVPGGRAERGRLGAGRVAGRRGGRDQRGALRRAGRADGARDRRGSRRSRRPEPDRHPRPQRIAAMRVVVAPDKFKGSATAAEVAAALAAGLRQGRPDLEVVELPVADGGDGTVAAALAAGFAPVVTVAEGPTGQPVETTFALKDAVAVIELADVAGLGRLPGGEPAPLTASTYGVGQVIGAALDGGATTIVLGIGGSATTDGGAGMVQALGVRLADEHGAELPRGGAALGALAAIDPSGLDSRIGAVRFLVASDVDNPLLGPPGAAAVFGPQKGASPADVRRARPRARPLGGADQVGDGPGPGRRPGSRSRGRHGLRRARLSRRAAGGRRRPRARPDRLRRGPGRDRAW